MEIQVSKRDTTKVSKNMSSKWEKKAWAVEKSRLPDRKVNTILIFVFLTTVARSESEKPGFRKEVIWIVQIPKGLQLQ